MWEEEDGWMDCSRLRWAQAGGIIGSRLLWMYRLRHCAAGDGDAAVQQFFDVSKHTHSGD